MPRSGIHSDGLILCLCGCLPAGCTQQHQRVAMGRAIVREPRVFLLDEPLSNLDAKLWLLPVV